MLQTEMARTNDAFKTTSRDRISNLEDEVGSLWAVVRELRAELGHKDEEVSWALFSALGWPSVRTRLVRDGCISVLLPKFVRLDALVACFVEDLSRREQGMVADITIRL